MHDDLGQERHGGDEPFPEPRCDHLARRIFEVFNIIEHSVIELLAEGLDCFFNFAVVDEMADGGVHIPCDDDIDAEGVAVHAAAFVPLGKAREKMGGFKTEGFYETHIHCRRL